MRVLGLDFGDKTIGVAVSDPARRIALGVEVIRRLQPEALRASVRRLEEIIRTYDADLIVLGYPKKLNGQVSARCRETEKFKQKLERNFKRISVVLWDERLSTRAAARGFDGPARRYEAHVDEMAAAYILQGYLDAQNKTEAGSITMADGDNTIIMQDEDGAEARFNVLASKELNGAVYMLAETDEAETDGDDGDTTAEVLYFKCVDTEGDDMVFELVDDEHEDYDAVFELFMDAYQELGIEY